MTKRSVSMVVALIAVMVLGVGGVVLAAPSARPTFAIQELTATLAGSNETKGGAPSGTGTSTVKLDTTKNEACFDIQVASITLPAAAAHIHEAPAGADGPVVVPLTAPDASGKASGCTPVDAALVGRIAANPANFYVNVHTSDFPAGAVRGQLSGASQPGATTVPAPTTGATTAPTAAATTAPTSPTAAPTATTPETLPGTGTPGSNMPWLLLGGALVLLLAGLGLGMRTQRHSDMK